ncbi:MAG: hypothetical protein HY720_09030 [Planctomycetes bacterium]|nr:hypothetical protein [Planctomycetota bacterium]
MRRKKWLLTGLVAVSLAAAGLAYGQTLVRADEPQENAGYVCPLTGEELPCPNCCPLNGK